MCHWEYHQEVIPLGQQLQVCEAAGADGWELCGMVMAALAPKTQIAVVSRESPVPQPGLLLLFKRPLAALNGQALLSGAAEEFIFAR